MSGIWGSGFNPDYDEADGSYFYGAAGTFSTTSTEASSSSSVVPEPSLSVFSGPRPGQQPNWPVPRARVSNYAKSAPNYAAIAHRAMTKEDVEMARLETLHQAQVAQEKEQQAKQNFLIRSQPALQSVCHFFQLGTCKYGQSCRFAHIILQEGAQEEREYGEYRENGKYGECGEYAEGCGEEGANGSGEYAGEEEVALSSSLSAAGSSFVYGGTGAGASVAPSSGFSRGVPLPASASRSGSGSGPGMRSGSRSGSEGPGEFLEASECGICMGDSPTDKLYGVLSHCNCVFCLSCIREWRADGAARNPGMAGSTVRQCPLCRVPSYFVVPSIRTFTLKSLVNAEASGGTEAIQTRQEHLQAEKKTFIDTYKRSLQQKPCRNYLADKSCPFGSSCFYLHIDANGELERAPDLDITSKPRYLLNQAGETVIIQQSVPQEAFKLLS